MKKLEFEYRDGTEYVSWVGDTDEAGSSTVADLQKSQPGTWALATPAYEAWKASKPAAKAAKDKAAEAKTAKDKAAADEDDEDDAEEPWKAPDKTKGAKK